MKRISLQIIILLTLSMMLISIPSFAQDEQTDTEDPVDGTAKGIIGCALLGGETTLLIEGAFRVRNPWLLSLIPIVTAAGGGVGGYFLEEASPEGAIATLLTGLALVIPTALIVMIGASYNPEDEEGYVDTTSSGEPAEVEIMPQEEDHQDQTETEVIAPESTEETEINDTTEIETNTSEENLENSQKESFKLNIPANPYN